MPAVITALIIVSFLTTVLSTYAAVSAAYSARQADRQGELPVFDYSYPFSLTMDGGWFYIIGGALTAVALCFAGQYAFSAVIRFWPVQELRFTACYLRRVAEGMRAGGHSFNPMIKWTVRWALNKTSQPDALLLAGNDVSRAIGKWGMLLLGIPAILCNYFSINSYLLVDAEKIEYMDWGSTRKKTLAWQDLAELKITCNHGERSAMVMGFHMRTQAGEEFSFTKTFWVPHQNYREKYLVEYEYKELSYFQPMLAWYRAKSGDIAITHATQDYCIEQLREGIKFMPDLYKMTAEILDVHL